MSLGWYQFILEGSSNITAVKEALTKFRELGGSLDLIGKPFYIHGISFHWPQTNPVLRSVIDELGLQN